MDDVRLGIAKIRFKNFRCYEDFEIDFVGGDGGIFSIFGLFGPNGSGKTTVLDAATLALSSYSSYTEDRLWNAMARYVRNFKRMAPQDQVKANFLLEVDIMSTEGNYTVAVSRNGYLKGHPQKVANTLLRPQCFRTRYDEELNIFQLQLGKWDIFKELFETVTGYQVEQIKAEMSPFTIAQGQNKRMACLDEYVLNLRIHKPDEIIDERECSKGEKKILKSFTTLLNREIMPSVILIDDIEMHVELDRHIKLIKCVERCFPSCQVIFTTHSPKIVYAFDINRLLDLTAKCVLPNVPWRKRLIRILSQVAFLQTNQRNRECTQSMLNELRTKSDLDKDWALHVTREAIFSASEVLYGQLNKVQKELGTQVEEKV